jgi:diacylglycerol kinase family enzyme
VTIVPPLEGELLATFSTAMTEGKDAALDRDGDPARAAVGGASHRAEPLTLNLDGEPVEATRFRIECMPGRVRMHLPADCPLRGNAAKVAA